LGTEVLSHLLLRQESQDFLKGTKIACSCAPIYHLVFVDDLIFFAKATSSEAANLNSCLDLYCRWSRQAINISKSSIHFSKNTATSTINSISGIFPFKRALISSKYLGLPLFFGKAKSIAFKDILEKVSRKIEGWHAKIYLKLGVQCLLNR
jgi:hypothetical protein